MRKLILATVAAAVVLSVPMAVAVKAEDTTVIKKTNDDGDRTKTVIKKDEPSEQKKVIIKKDHDE
jgi:predicted peptidase